MRRPGSEGKRRLAVALLLTGTLLAAFSPVRDAGFLSLDDRQYVTGNARVLAGLSWSGMRWAFGATDAGIWHPLTWLSYMADIELAGDDPHWFHLVNLFFHVVTSLLLLTVLARLTGAFWRSALVSALFAVHPLRVESVAWIAERKDVLFGCFWLLTLGAYQTYARRPHALRYLAVITLFALGLMAKPMLVTLPFVLLLLDFWPLGRWRPRARPSAAGAVRDSRPRSITPAAHLILEKLPLLLLSALFSGVAYLAQQEAEALRSLAAYPLAGRIGNAATSYVAYLRDTVWPAALSVVYPHPRQGIDWWGAAFAGLLLFAVTIALLRASRVRPALAVGWAWFLGTLVPVIGLVQIGLQSRADRYMYIPQIGLGLMSAWAIPAGWPPRRRILCVPAAAIIVLALAAMTRIQSGYWRDDDRLLGHAIEATADNWLAHRHLALSLEQRGRREEAVAHLREVQRIKPGYLDTHAVFGLVIPGRGGGNGEAPSEVQGASEEGLRENAAGEGLRDKGRLDEAIAAFRRAVRVSPDFTAARLNLANSLARKELHDEAIHEYREVLRTAPRHGLALNNMAGVLKMKGNVRESIEYYRRAAGILPRSADVHANFGRALFELGEIDEALATFQKAARINQRFTKEMAALAGSLLARGDVDGARRWYRAALDLNPGDAALKAGLDAAR